jgi:hypothetical protein
MTTTLLRIDFIHDKVMIPVPTRLNDNLPPYVKGNIYWHLTQGCYYLPYEGNHALVEFINDEWFILTKNETIFQSCPERRIPKNSGGTRWWRDDDVQHPDNWLLNAARDPGERDVEEEASM